MLTISAVAPGSTAARAGLRPGDRLISINGHALKDSIDYQYFSGDDRLRLSVQSPGGRTRNIVLRKDPDDTLGVEFPTFPVTKCRNHCIFCFVDQMPKGCRRSLVVKDDDYRASFLFGNYITLSNMNEGDWDRILRQRLSPLYLSVHATEPELRAFLLGRRFPSDILPQIDRLAQGGIQMHAQVVLCPGINDGPHLARTIEDLSRFYPAVQSIAVVPVGLTSFRSGLFSLRTYRMGEARRVIYLVEETGKRLLRRFGSRLVFASDEFYIKARLPFPLSSHYEGFPQLENGVGMVSSFLQEVKRTHLPRRFPIQTVTVVTGVSFAPILADQLKRTNAVAGAKVRMVVVRNRFFGESVTVSGLLTGSDLERAIHGKRLGSLLVIPSNTLKDDGRTFLDDRTLDDLARAAGVPVSAVSGFGEFIELLSTQNGRGGQQ